MSLVSWLDKDGEEHTVTTKVKDLLESKWRGQMFGGDALRTLEFFTEEAVFLQKRTISGSPANKSQVKTKLTLKDDPSWSRDYAVMAINPTRLVETILKNKNIDDARKVELCKHLRCKAVSDWMTKYEEARGTNITNAPGAAALEKASKVGLTEAEKDEDFAGFERVLFVETGFGADQHGQEPTKAVVRAARNAIEFNSLPSIGQIVPGGYDGMKLRLDVALPAKYHAALDLAAVKAVFPYGIIVAVELQQGGALFHSGIALEKMGDTSDEMIVAIVAVIVGY